MFFRNKEYIYWTLLINLLNIIKKTEENFNKKSGKSQEKSGFFLNLF